VLATGLGFTEGPTITSDGELVVVSIDQGRLYRITEAGAGTLAQLDGGPNGATADENDVIYVAQNGGNWMRNANPERAAPAGMSGGIQRVTLSGAATWISRDPLAPNDLCFGPDGNLYVTDPTRNRKYDDGRIWRCDVATGQTVLLHRVAWFCNGIGFGPDDRLYVASSGDRRIMRFTVNETGLEDEEIVCQMGEHAPDGFAFDIDGNLVIASLSRTETPGELQVWTPEGRLLERIRTGRGRHYTNVALDGAGHLVFTDSDGGQVMCVDEWPAVGLALYPFRHIDRRSPKLSPGLLALDPATTLETSSAE
jgi:gluconolactonase